MTPIPKLHEEVVLLRDLPDQGLRRGDVGTVVFIYEDDAAVAEGYEVEFFTALGKTRAVFTLSAGDVRPLGDGDVVTVRSLDKAG
jgi:hypothetical protein